MKGLKTSLSNALERLVQLGVFLHLLVFSVPLLGLCLFMSSLFSCRVPYFSDFLLDIISRNTPFLPHWREAIKEAVTPDDGRGRCEQSELLGLRNGSLGVMRTRARVPAFSSLYNRLRGVDGMS